MLCCVPNCNNKSSQASCFKFPTNKSLQEEWLRNLPIKLNRRQTGVCILHFEDRFLKRSNDNPLKGRLVSGAVPTIFLKDEAEDKTDDVQPDIISQHVVIEVDSNAIPNFDALKADLVSSVRLDDWKVAYSETNLIIYKLMVESTGNLRVETSISIDSGLVLKIFHLDKALGLKFSPHTVHRAVKLKRWSQLQKLIDKFNSPHELKVHSERVRYE
ncbi:uncharacterized protein LOC119080094 [Bradysia coprophila]|uniref:uncharacterized protein LOC119080094 n=1 Tax=Bradysia coprophila TaxID=38358 RepID=UPI00187DC605|nr:uncharacterized protein LOC119080094 [Bradysia coprophila]